MLTFDYAFVSGGVGMAPRGWELLFFNTELVVGSSSLKN